MARYLSAEWFAAVDSEPLAAAPTLVLEQVVRDAPEGQVVYRVEVGADRARVVWPVPEDAPPADLRITTDWATSVAVARGDLSTQRALMQGRLRVGGRPDRLPTATATLAGLDPVPVGVRESTTYPD
jgi:hypothetical protein